MARYRITASAMIHVEEIEIEVEAPSEEHARQLVEVLGDRTMIDVALFDEDEDADEPIIVAGHYAGLSIDALEEVTADEEEEEEGRPCR